VPDEKIPERALAIYGHPDDTEIAAGGALARWADAGTEVWVLITTRGDKGNQDPTANRDKVAQVRVEETAAACAVLGVARHLHLDHDDGELSNDLALRAELVAVVREFRPDVVLAPDPTAVFFGDSYFNHRDHRETGWAALDAISPAAGNPHYFREQIANGLSPHSVPAIYLSGTLEPNAWIDIETTLERKIDAVFCHASQLEDTGDWFRAFLRERAEGAGQSAGVRYAEAFRRITFAA
jgi:LmbE family N-acetylglucosaminyl deacetylase